MIRFFRTLQPATLFVIPLVALLLWSPGFFRTDFYTKHPDLLAGFLLDWIALLPRFLEVLICAGVVAISAIYLNLVMNRHEVLYRNTYLPSFIYVLLMSFHRDVICLHPLLFSNLLLIACFDRIFSLFKNDSPVSPIVDGFLFLSAATFLHFPIVILFFLLLYAVYSLRSFNLREWTIAFVLFLLPYFFLGVYAFWTDSLLDGLRTLGSHFAFHRIHFTATASAGLFLFGGLSLILIVLALIRLRIHFYKNSIKTRSTQEILILFILFTLGGLFFGTEIQLADFTQLAIPFSVILSYWYLSATRRMWLYETSMWLLVAGILLNHF